MKFGRNEPCPCGSGKKFKRCCIDKPLIKYPGKEVKSADPLPVKEVPTSHFFDIPDDSLVSTTTGELYHPVRLYYRMFDKGAVKRVFQKLQCMDYDKDYGRWVWLYHDEAKYLEFPKKYSDLPKNIHPIVIGSFFTRSDDEMYLDVRSIERAENAAVFFDKHIDRSIAEFTDIAITNRFINAKSRKDFFNFDFLFDRDDVVVNSGEELFDKIDDLKHIDDIDERRKIGIDFLFSKMKEKYPDIERFPSHFYDDGIDMLVFKLRKSQKVAMERFDGNENITPFDHFNQLTNGHTPFD